MSGEGSNVFGELKVSMFKQQADKFGMVGCYAVEGIDGDISLVSFGRKSRPFMGCGFIFDTTKDKANYFYKHYPITFFYNHSYLFEPTIQEILEQLPQDVLKVKHLLLSPDMDGLHDLIVMNYHKHLSIVTVAFPLSDSDGYVELQNGDYISVHKLSKLNNNTTKTVVPMYCDGVPFEECYLCNFSDYDKSIVHKHIDMVTISTDLATKLMSSNNRNVIAVSIEENIMSCNTTNPIRSIPNSLLDEDCDNYVFAYRYVTKLSPASGRTLYMETYSRDKDLLGGDLWLVHIVKIKKNPTR